MIRRYGAKLAVSAAIMALEKLEPAQQLKYIDMASAEEPVPEKSARPLREILRRITEKGVGSIEEPIKIFISPSDEQAWDDLRRVVEAVRGKKKARRSG